MMQTAGQGVVIHALLKLGFKCTYDDFDLCRLRHVDEERRIQCDVDVTFQLVDIEQAQPRPCAPPVGLTAPMAWLSHALSQVDCQYDPTAFRGDDNTVVFVRNDVVTVPRIQTGTRVTARAKFAPLPGPSC